MMPAQAEGEGAFDYLQRLKKEHERTKQIIRATKGGRFKGRKPDGRWWVRFGYGSDAKDVFGSTPVELILKAASFRCYACGHGAQSHAKRSLSEEARKGKPHPEEPRCNGVDCSCVKTPEEVLELQQSKKWIAERLAAYLMGFKDNTEWRLISQYNVFAGLREPETGASDAA